MKNPLRLTFSYILCAIASTAANIAAQHLSLGVPWPRYPIAASMVVGTAVGLVVKYVLDKRYIFAHKSTNTRHEAQTFVRYCAMGGVTTAVFWGVELAFHKIFATDIMRYVGGCIGLAIGYALKYWLDKHFVFHSSAQHVSDKQTARMEEALP